jgi:hypothetical protein
MLTPHPTMKNPQSFPAFYIFQTIDSGVLPWPIKLGFSANGPKIWTGRNPQFSKSGESGVSPKTSTLERNRFLGW